MQEDSQRITALLREWSGGDRRALDSVVEIVYNELRNIAARFMQRESPQHTLQTTALLHELYLRLCAAEPFELQDRDHFFAIAAQQVRRILVDHARRAKSEKRGGQYWQVTLAGSEQTALALNEELVAMDEALQRLEELDTRAAKVVELRFFGGLTEPETARLLGISAATARRDWDFARTWLASQLA